jgi:hypothetical protein
MPDAVITASADAWNYITGGHGSFTLVSKKSGTRFTYKARWVTYPINTLCFIDVLTAPDTYTYMGLLDTEKKNVRITRGSKVLWSAPSFKALTWVLGAIKRGGNLPDCVEFWHDGRCCKCGRQLTVPSSIAAGIGPVCASRL